VLSRWGETYVMFVQYVVTRLGVLLACRKKLIDNFSNAVPVGYHPL